MLHLFKNYSPKHDKYVTLKYNLVDNVSKFYEGREKIIEGFKNEVFPLYYDKEYEDKWSLKKKKKKKHLIQMNLINGLINKKQA